MKLFFLKVANAIAIGWRLIPERLRLNFVTGLLIVETRHCNAAQGLSSLLRLRDRLDWVLNERAMIYGKGEHPKHRLTNYHNFFIEHIEDGEKVLDVGCGYGAVARSIARARPRCRVVGIDNNPSRLEQARGSDNPANLSFILGDASIYVPTGRWDVLVLSNVLEHIDDRIDFLKSLRATTAVSRYLIRVPLFERDWQMALRRELGVDFRSDDDHRIEHTLAEFRSEIGAAGLVIREMQTLWGEIWADCCPLMDMTECS